MSVVCKPDLSAVLEQVKSCSPQDMNALAKAAIELARSIQTRAKQLQTSAERRQQAEAVSRQELWPATEAATVEETTREKLQALGYLDD